ncbi:hypothetical protein GGH94_006278, partial [Coemansia aciculifera]
MFIINVEAVLNTFTDDGCETQVFKYEIKVDSLEDTFASVMTKVTEQNNHYSARNFTFSVKPGLSGKPVDLNVTLSSKDVKHMDTIYTYPDLEADRMFR